MMSYNYCNGMKRILIEHRHNFIYHRTNGPVNAHLTPGPGIYFKAIRVYSPRAGADHSLGKMLMSTESLYHFAHLLQV